jgi:hypothetical protein
VVADWRLASFWEQRIGVHWSGSAIGGPSAGSGCPSFACYLIDNLCTSILSWMKGSVNRKVGDLRGLFQIGNPAPHTPPLFPHRTRRRMGRMLRGTCEQ